MKYIYILIIGCILPLGLLANGPSLGELESGNNAVPKLSLSANPMGFLFFGPTIDLGVGIKQRTGINLHARFTPLGLLSQVAKKDKDEDLEEFKGTGVGAGVFHFLGDGAEGIYVGAQVEYEKMTTRYELGEDWEWYEVGNNYVFVLNGGFRKNFENGIYLNLGVFLGGIYTDYYWEYEDEVFGQTDEDEREGTTFFPVGSLEFAIGIPILN